MKPIHRFPLNYSIGNIVGDEVRYEGVLNMQKVSLYPVRMSIRNTIAIHISTLLNQNIAIRFHLFLRDYIFPHEM